MASNLLVLKQGHEAACVGGWPVFLNAHQCLAFDGSQSDARLLDRVGRFLLSQPGLAVYGAGPLLESLLAQTPELADHLEALIVDGPLDLDTHSFPVHAPSQLPSGIRTVFLAETRYYPRALMRKRLPSGVKVIDLDVLSAIGLDLIPEHAWSIKSKNIYPLDLPEIRFQKDLDLLLIDCPARNLALMPSGLGYVHNALKLSDVRFQTFDVDIVLYHRYHLRRIFDECGKVVLPSGKEMPLDPWQAEHYDLWSDPEVLDYFKPEIDEVVNAVLEAHPKVLGLSIHQCNEWFSRAVVNGVKAQCPEILILVGGFSCYQADIGLRAFPEADYMCIGEADLTVGPLMEQLAAGEFPGNQPGIMSRFDSPDWRFVPGPMVQKLDSIDFPRYDWFDLKLYHNYNGYQLTPVIASRGCRWSRCTFCAERFFWRIRNPKLFVDELEWLIDQGCDLFMFNESDLNGMPEVVLEICEEIIRRNLHLQIKLTGQLRIHKNSDRAFFDKLKQAGFTALRFGVDAFSENTLRLQMKGYNTATVSQNLKDCWEAGIFTEVNWVIGVPGETDQDVREGIELCIENRAYIGRLANINPLIMVTGSVYWFEPERHNIVFRGSKEELYKANPRSVPADLWYSTEPYIDHHVRKERFGRIALALTKGGVNVGPWAAKIIEVVEKGQDKARAGNERDDVLAEPCQRTETPTWPAPEMKAAELSEGQIRQLAGDYAMRAGSTSPLDKPAPPTPRLLIVGQGREFFGVATSELESAFGRSAIFRAGAEGEWVRRNYRLLNVLPRILSPAPMSEDMFTMVDQLIHHIQQLLAARDFHNADQTSFMVVSKIRDNATLWLLRAIVLRSMGRADEALSAVEHSLQLGVLPQAQEELTYLYRSMGFLEDSPENLAAY